MTLSLDQMRALAVPYVDWDPDIMAAIGEEESSGDPNVVNSIGCVGLWQINWPVWKKDPGFLFNVAKSSDALKDPKTNARGAHYVYVKQGYTAWTTYTSKAYLKHYKPGDVGNAIAGQGKSALTTATGSVLPDIAGAIANATNGVLNTFKNVAVTGGALVIGLVLIILGVVLLNHNNIKSATKTVVGVVK